MAANPHFYPTRDMSLPERASYRLVRRYLLVRAIFSGQYRQPFYETLCFHWKTARR
ncbi:hypothetical protein M5G07_08545 [Serratia symbiotica]|nr:hypothetical protein [Serratia symbiotica]